MNFYFRYHLEQPHSLFEIDTNSGWIKVFNELDAEKELSHELKVKAEDGNGLSALATVRIHVQDVNDNPHQFTQLHYNAAVNEGALPGTNVQNILKCSKNVQKCPKCSKMLTATLTNSLSCTTMMLSMREHYQVRMSRAGDFCGHCNPSKWEADI